MKAMFIHAHFDDYEFTAAGTFELWKRHCPEPFQAKIVICTDGQAGHHFRTREETGQLRLREQLASAQIGEYQFEQLRYPNGQIPREACLQVSIPLLASLWKTIRDFEPDYLFCPPLPADPLAGVHIDHVAVAQAVRHVAYMINVPHAFTPEYPADETVPAPCKVPVILHVYDDYMSGSNAFDLAINIQSSFDAVCHMTWCHASQIMEWLPWVGRHQMETPQSFEQWTQTLRNRFQRQQRELGIQSMDPFEVFTVSAWGVVPTADQLLRDLPGIAHPESNLDRLAARLQRWRGDPPSS